MVTKVHAGLYRQSSASGSVRCFIIKGVAASDAVSAADGTEYTLKEGAVYDYDEGTAVPNTAADMAIRLVQSRCTPIAMEIDGADLHILVANNVNAWGYDNAFGANADLELALKALGSVDVSTPTTGGTSPHDFSAATVIETDMVFDATKVVGAAAGDNRTVGGLGGNEHDQDTFSNESTAP